MLPKCGVSHSFLDLFYHEIVNQPLGKQNKLNLFVLKIQNNRFCYKELVEELYDIIITYALSRQNIASFKNSIGGKKYKAAITKLRNYTSNEGELGEILLYSFLESHLNAPKILSKLEIKTANNDYVKGADGVHILRVDENNFQLVFGESKLNSDLSKGIYEAFSSIIKFLKLKTSKLGFEIGLVNSELFKEVCDEKSYEYLKKIIIPSARTDITNMDYSFGLFLGYNHDFCSETKEMSNSECRAFIRDEIKNKIFESILTIKKQLAKDDLHGFNFYIYVMPFSDIDKQRKQIIEDLS